MKARLFLAAPILLCLSAPSLGQNASRIPDPAAVPREVSRSNEASEAQRVMNEYGACIVKTSRRRAEAALNAFPGSQAAAEALSKLASSNCLMHGELRFQPILFRGSLFEALYLTDYKSGAVDISAVTPLDYFAGAPDRASEEVRGQVALRQFADCVARANPIAARSLVLSRVGAEAANSSFATLMPTLSECLSRGVALKFSRPMLRGLIAESLYRLSRAAASTRDAR